MKKQILIILIVLSVVLFWGCSSNKESEDEKAIREVVEQNFKYFEQKDWEAYSKTVDMSEEEVEQHNKELDEMFSKYEIRFDIEEFEITKIEGNKAEVRVVAVTQNMNDLPYKDNRSTAIHEMIKKDGKWLFCKSIITETDPFFGYSSDKESEDKKAIREVVEQNLKYFEQKDWEAYSKTVDMPEEEVEQHNKELDEMFSEYEIRFDIEEFEITKIEGDKAEVRVVAVSKNINDLPYKDNRSTAIHKMIKKDGKWLFSSSEIEDTEYLSSEMPDDEKVIEISSEEQEAIKEVVELNFKYFAEKDWASYLDTVDIPEEYVEEEIRGLEEELGMYELEFTTEKLEIVWAKGNEAEIRVTTVTRNKNDEPYVDNRATGLHKMVKKDGKWLFSESKIEKTEYLD
ncbi:MAG: hypothetical protein CSB16_01555 [Clostridiales bacterium]|nr:MAG: hypothetical protein CSB16_01555 [Clostridiales bacterium]